MAVGLFSMNVDVTRVVAATVYGGSRITDKRALTSRMFHFRTIKYFLHKSTVSIHYFLFFSRISELLCISDNCDVIYGPHRMETALVKLPFIFIQIQIHSNSNLFKSCCLLKTQ